MLDIAVSRGWPLRQLDVNNAFLQGNDIYMVQPAGFVDKDRPHYVCKLRKALYGLKQAPRVWYEELGNFLIASGFKNSLSDAALFIMCSSGILLYVLVYVDGIVVTANDPKRVQQFIELLSNHFSLKDLGDLNYFLGIEATRSKSGLLLTQTKYINVF